HARRLQVGPPRVGRAEVAPDEVAEGPLGRSAAAAEMAEIELVVLDSADGEAEVHLQRAQLGIDLVGSSEVDVGELAEDLVPLPDVALVELEMGLDRGAGDPVELQDLRPERARRDLLEPVDERGHERGAYPPSQKREELKGAQRWPLNCPTCRTHTTRSSRTSTPRRCGSTTTSTTAPTSRTQTPRSRGPSWRTPPSRACSRTSRCFPRTSGRRGATKPAAPPTPRCSGRSWARTAAASRAACCARRSRTRSAHSTSSRPRSTTA